MMSHPNKRKPSARMQAMHTQVTTPQHRRKTPQPKIDPEEARLRQVRHAIEDRAIERELGLR